MREANASLGSQQKSTQEGQGRAWSGITVSPLEQCFHVEWCFPTAGWEVNGAAGEPHLEAGLETSSRLW